MALTSCGPVPFALTAIAASASFAAVAFHLSIVDGAAAQECGAVHGVERFRTMYPLSKKSQVALALLSGASGAVASVLSAGTTRYLFAAGAIFTPLAIPYTVFALLPINNQILQLDTKTLDEKDTLALLKKWCSLNLVRPILASVAVVSLSVGVSLLKK